MTAVSDERLEELREACLACAQDVMADIIDELLALRASRAQSERDAERYMALRSGKLHQVCGLYVADGGHDWRSVEEHELDQRIDAAMANSTPSAGGG